MTCFLFEPSDGTPRKKSSRQMQNMASPFQRWGETTIPYRKLPSSVLFHIFLFMFFMSLVSSTEVMLAWQWPSQIVKSCLDLFGVNNMIGMCGKVCEVDVWTTYVDAHLIFGGGEGRNGEEFGVCGSSYREIREASWACIGKKRAIRSCIL